MKYYLLAVLSLACTWLTAQNISYRDSLTSFRESYIKEHAVVKGEDKKYLQFFPVDEQYRVNAKFELAQKPEWFNMETSSGKKKIYRTYGTVSFSIRDTLVRLNLYQSQQLMQADEYRNYLFLPFTDKTSGEESYGTGRYIDLRLEDISNNRIVIDFNKAYNPYCCYETGKYNCPIPPAANDLPVAINAGEKNFGKSH